MDVQRHLPLANADVRAAAYLDNQALHDGFARVVGDVGDSAAGMPAFARQVQAVMIPVERHALRQQPFDCRFALRQDGADGGFVAQIRARFQGIGNVFFDVVLSRPRRRNPALRMTAGGIVQPVFAQNNDAERFRQRQGERQCRQSVSGNQYVAIGLHGVVLV